MGVWYWEPFDEILLLESTVVCNFNWWEIEDKDYPRIRLYDCIYLGEL